MCSLFPSSIVAAGLIAALVPAPFLIESAAAEPMTTTVTLSVLKGKTELWKRELAGNPWSPPPP